jgi:hypothetical protein
MNRIPKRIDFESGFIDKSIAGARRGALNRHVQPNGRFVETRSRGVGPQLAESASSILVGEITLSTLLGHWWMVVVGKLGVPRFG